MSSGPEQSEPLSSPSSTLLEATTGDEIMLTYKEVAALIGGPLPEAAILSTAWWTARRYAQVQMWRAMGWVAHPSAAQMRVRFTRDAEEG